MATKRKIEVKGVSITITNKNSEDFISLTDIASGFEGTNALIEKWIRNKNTIEFLAVWEQLYNPDFSIDAYKEIIKEAGNHRFVISAKKWINLTNSIGIIASAGRYGGTYARKEITIEFCTWLNPSFKFEIISRSKLLEADFEELFQNIFSTIADLEEINITRYVYIMQDLSTNFYKVGVSKNLNYREKTLQSQKPTILYLFSKSFKNKEKAYEFELHLHKLYASKRVRGEWFDFSSSDLNNLKSIFKTP
jgi:hypothetical protein